MSESIPFFNYEMFTIIDEEKDSDSMIRILMILLEPFDKITKILILNSIFGLFEDDKN